MSVQSGREGECTALILSSRLIAVIPCIEGEIPANAPLDRLSSMFGSIYPAIWSFQLALRSRGLGSTLTTVHLLKAKEVGELLGLPAGVTQVALLPVAYTKGTDFKRAPRLPASEVTHFNGW